MSEITPPVMGVLSFLTSFFNEFAAICGAIVAAFSLSLTITDRLAKYKVKKELLKKINEIKTPADALDAFERLDK